MDLFKRLKNWFQVNPDQEINGRKDLETLRDLMAALENTNEIEYDCEQVYQLLDQFVDMIKRGENADELMPLVHHHLEMCRDCYEEYEALLQVLENSPGFEAKAI